MNIEIISGSPRKASITIRAAYLLQQWLQKNSEHQVGLIDCRDYALPWVQSVFKSVESTPDEFKPLAERMFGAQAFIFVTPEYNGSYSPSLKNLLDHFPKQLHKPIGIVTASDGKLGGMRAAQQMILLAAGLFGIASPNLLIIPEIDKKIDETGKLIEPLFEKNVHNFVSEFLWLAERIVK